MKIRWFIIGMLLILCMGAYLETRQHGWLLLKTGTSDDTALDGTTSGLTYVFSDKPSSAKPVEYGWNGVDIYFKGVATPILPGDVNEKYVDYKVYIWKNESGPGLLWCYGRATMGTAVTGVTNGYFVDTVTCTDVHAETEGTRVKFTDSGNNRVAVLRLGDVRGAKWVNIEYDFPTDGNVAATSMTSEYTGY